MAFVNFSRFFPFVIGWIGVRDGLTDGRRLVVFLLKLLGLRDINCRLTGCVLVGCPVRIGSERDKSDESDSVYNMCGKNTLLDIHFVSHSARVRVRQLWELRWTSALLTPYSLTSATSPETRQY